MLFGYLMVRTLLPFLERRPDSWSRRFAAILNAAWRPFHVINYVGSVGGGQLAAEAQVPVEFRELAGDIESCWAGSMLVKAGPAGRGTGRKQDCAGVIDGLDAKGVGQQASDDEGDEPPELPDQVEGCEQTSAHLVGGFGLEQGVKGDGAGGGSNSVAGERAD